MKTQSALLLSAFAVTSVAVQGQLASWNFEALTITTGTPASAFGPIAADSGSGSASGLHASPASAWSTPAGNGSTKSFSSNGWTTGDYYQFQVSGLALTTGKLQVSWDHTGSNTGPRDFTLEYSTAADFSSLTALSTYSLTADGWSPTTPKTASQRSAETAFGDYSAFSTVYFRLVDTGTLSITGAAVGSGGTSRVDNFSVSFTTVPEPGEYAAMFAGGLLAFALVRRQVRK